MLVLLCNNPTSNVTKIDVLAVHIFGILWSTREYPRVIRSIREHFGVTPEYFEVLPIYSMSTPGTPESIGVQLLNISTTLQS